MERFINSFNFNKRAMVDSNRRIKCEGRFKELREYLYNDVAPIVLEGRTEIKREDIKDMWDLISQEVGRFDFKDPYYDSTIDNLRERPHHDYLSLTPLFAYSKEPFVLEEKLIREYVLSMGNNVDIAEKISKLGAQPRRFLHDLEREEKDLSLPDGKNLGGYIISGNFGIGTIATGGVGGGGIRADAPFLIEVYNLKDEGEQNLVAIIGFWAQNNEMLVSQIQSCKNARYPEGTPFGVGSLRVAETIARLSGFDNIITYNARGHPIFKEHPENWEQLNKDFICIYDNSSKKLGFVGTRNSHYTKPLRNHDLNKK